MKKGRLLLFITFCCCIAPLQAQWDAPVSRFWMVRDHYNPAFSGSEGHAFSALYRYQWAGIQFAPQRFFLSGQLPIYLFNRQHGVGINTSQSKAGHLRNKQLSAQYNYILPTPAGKLHFGIQAGVMDLTFDEGSAHISDQGIENNKPSYIAPGIKKQLIDLGTGLAWVGNKGWLGISLLHLNKPSYHIVPEALNHQSDSLEASIPHTIHLMAKYNIQPFHSLLLEPMIWWQYQNNSLQIQIALNATVANRIMGGLSLRTDDGYGLFAGFKLNNLQIMYGYDRHTRGMGKSSRGSQELSLRYRFDIGDTQPNWLLQKSIRTL